MISRYQEKKFFFTMLPDDASFLSEALDWIRDNLPPEEVFTESQLQAWAVENGYVVDEG